MANKREKVQRQMEDKKKFEKGSWIYKKNGVDYGPFSFEEMDSFVLKGEILPQTPIRELKSKKWKTILDFLHFKETHKKYLAELKRREEEKAIEKFKDRVTKVHKVKKRVPILFVGLIIFGGIIAAIILRPQTLGRGGVLLNIFKDINLQYISEFKEIKTQNSLEESRKEQQKKKISKKTPFRARESKEEQALIDMSFEEDFSSSPLEEEKLNAIINEVKKEVVFCFHREAKLNPLFSKANLLFYIESKGALRFVNLATENEYSKDLPQCIKSVFQRIKIEPFSGNNRRVELPISVIGN